MSNCLNSGLVDHLATLIAPDIPLERGHGQEAISRDAEIFERLLTTGGDTVIRLWTNRKCLVTTRAIARRPEFAHASAQARASGWPVYIRHSGGFTVVHRPGILNISMFWHGKGDQPDIQVPYGRLVGRIGSALEKLGVGVSVGSVAESYCDGRYNILAGGRKIAGTACHSRAGKTRFAQMAHASLLVDGSLENDIDAITRFERAIGTQRSYRVDAHVTVAELMERDGTSNELARTCVRPVEL